MPLVLFRSCVFQVRVSGGGLNDRPRSRLLGNWLPSRAQPSKPHSNPYQCFRSIPLTTESDTDTASSIVPSQDVPVGGRVLPSRAELRRLAIVLHHRRVLLFDPSGNLPSVCANDSRAYHRHIRRLLPQEITPPFRFCSLIGGWAERNSSVLSHLWVFIAGVRARWLASWASKHSAPCWS